MKKGSCLILGGGGFIGSHLTEKLLAGGYEVTIFDKVNFSKQNVSQFTENIKITEGDFNNGIDIKKSLRNIEYVYHLVSSTLPASSNDNPIFDAETNLISTLRLLKECVNNILKKVIFLSSGGTVYGVPEKIPISENDATNPICSYGIIKRTIEQYLFMFEKIYGLDYFVFRLSNPYGERQNPLAAQGVIPVFINKIINNETLEIWGDGVVVRDYIYVGDAVNVLSDSLGITSNQKILNLSSGCGYSINEIIEIIKTISKKKVHVQYLKGRNVDVPVNILDNNLVKKIFEWMPETKIEDGIKLVYNHLSESSPENK